MKCYKMTTVFYTCLAVTLAGLVFSGCGKSSSGGGTPPAPVSTTAWYQDSDGDGFGNLNKTTTETDQPDGYVDNSFDCNDADVSINPAAIELMDGVDNNCDGLTDKSPKVSIKIPDTGQIASYTNTFGEDSDYLVNSPSYTKLDANGGDLPDSATSWKMVRDNVTNLIWELKDTSDEKENRLNPHDADNTYTLEEATVFIAALNTSKFGSYSDWRLPSIKELAFLANSSGSDPCITTTYFPLVKTNSQIWSDTDYVTDSTKSWFYSVTYNKPLFNVNTTKLLVWAVRNVEPLPEPEENALEFEEYGPAIVKDNNTGLMWQKATAKGDDDGGMIFEDAITYCENLELGGFKDWRLPNKNELMSLNRFDLMSPAVDPLFDDTTDGWYWTSTTFFNSYVNYAWSMNLYSSAAGYFSKTDLKWVRAVRGGKSAITKIWYRDGDADGYGDDAVQKVIDASQAKPTGYVDNNTDCNDAESGISPAAAEIPDDGVDQNCTGSDTFTWYKDADIDGFGDQNSYLIAETKPAIYIHNSEDIEDSLFDCDDNNKSINPDMAELVDDGLDNNCNGLQSVSWYLDSDGDGYGDGARVSASEDAPAGGTYASNDLDCNDGNADIRPGFAEVFEDTVDSNCNGNNNDTDQMVVPDTGQIASYTGTPGEDGDYLINSPSFTKIGSDGSPLDASATGWVAVRDNVTGLYWEVKTAATKNASYTYAYALDYAASLDLGSHDDWRVPTMTELATIANLDLNSPAINSDYFPNVVSDKYWTVTDQGSDVSAEAVSFRYGETYRGNKTDYFRVIAVRGGQSLAARLIANGDGTVSDAVTGLMWNDLLVTSDTWDNSVAGNWSGGAGYNDWRLPSESDMDTLLNILEEDSSFDFSTVFTTVTFTGSFWTSTLAATDPGKAIVFSFITGETDEAGLLQVLNGIGVRGVKQSRFIVNDDGTVFDSKTGLMWMRETGNDGIVLGFEGVLANCNTLIFAGYEDWRLPSRNEMISLLAAFLEDSAGYSAAFPDSEAVYWTSSSCPGLTDSDYAWQISFETGTASITIGDYSNENVFRAVRGGNPE